MFNFAEQADIPIQARVGDTVETFPLVHWEMYEPWIAELTAKRKQIALKHAPPMTNVAGRATERANYLNWVENIEVTPGNLQEMVLRAAGMKRVIDLAFECMLAQKLKHDLNSEEKKQAAEMSLEFRRRMGAKVCEMFAVEVSGLFRREEIDVMYPVKDDPDHPNGKGESAKGSRLERNDTESIGLPSLASSDSSAVATREK
jgi:hypothetical protein